MPVSTRARKAAVPPPPPAEGEDPDQGRLPNEDEIWYLLHSYFEAYGCCRHNIESFDHFMHTLLPHIVQEVRAARSCQHPSRIARAMC